MSCFCECVFVCVYVFVMRFGEGVHQVNAMEEKKKLGLLFCFVLSFWGGFFFGFFFFLVL